MSVPDDLDDVLDFGKVEAMLKVMPGTAARIYYIPHLLSLLDSTDGSFSQFAALVDLERREATRRMEELHTRVLFFEGLKKRLESIHHSLLEIKEMMEKQQILDYDPDF